MLVQCVAYATVGNTHLEIPCFQVITLCEGVINRIINALHHGGQNLARVQIVLVAVHTYGQDALISCGLQNTNASATSRRKHNVSSLADLCFGQLGTFYRVIPSGRRSACHVGNHCRA